MDIMHSILTTHYEIVTEHYIDKNKTKQKREIVVQHLLKESDFASLQDFRTYEKKVREIQTLLYNETSRKITDSTFQQIDTLFKFIFDSYAPGSFVKIDHARLDWLREHACIINEAHGYHRRMASESKFRQVFEDFVFSCRIGVGFTFSFYSNPKKQARYHESVKKYAIRSECETEEYKEYVRTQELFQSNPTQKLPNENPLRKGIPDHKIWVYINNCTCLACTEQYCCNTIGTRIAEIQSADGWLRTIVVSYCKGCGRVFLQQNQLKEYVKMFGNLLCEFITPTNTKFRLGDGFGASFSQDTILSRCGYTVNKALPIEERRNILNFILQTKKSSRSEIIEILQGFIRIRKNNKAMEDACRIWRSDIDYILSLSAKID